MNPFESLQNELSEIKTLLIDIKAEQKGKTEFEEYPDNMTRRQVAKMLGVAENTIDRYAANGLVKKYRMGKLVRFKKSEIVKTFKTFQKWQRV